MCISLGTGNTSPSIAARAMGNGSYRMNYNLYTDPGYSSVWGAATTSPPTSQVLTDVIDASLSVPIYAKLPGGQTSVSTVGNADTQYQEIYSGASVHVEVQTALFFLIRSIVRCSDLGHDYAADGQGAGAEELHHFRHQSGVSGPGVLTVPVPGSSQISVQCTNNNAYSLALNGGTVGGNVLARKMKHSTAADTVGYQLYQGSNYAIVWGDATGGSPKTGLGLGTVQNHTVYGRVPAQTTPRPGSYSDTVTATITF